MLALLLKTIFVLISTLSTLLTRLFIFLPTYLLVAIIKACKVPGQAAHNALENVAEVIKSCCEYLLGIIVDIIGSLVSTALNQLIEAAKGSAAATGTAASYLAEQTRTSLEGLLKDLPEIAEGFADMIKTVVTNLCDSYTQALEYLRDNA